MLLDPQNTPLSVWTAAAKFEQKSLCEAKSRQEYVQKIQAKLLALAQRTSPRPCKFSSPMAASRPTMAASVPPPTMLQLIRRRKHASPSATPTSPQESEGDEPQRPPCPKRHRSGQNTKVSTAVYAADAGIPTKVSTRAGSGSDAGADRSAANILDSLLSAELPLLSVSQAASGQIIFRKCVTTARSADGDEDEDEDEGCSEQELEEGLGIELDQQGNDKHGAANPKKAASGGSKITCGSSSTAPPSFTRQRGLRACEWCSSQAGEKFYVFDKGSRVLVCSGCQIQSMRCT